MPGYTLTVWYKQLIGEEGKRCVPSQLDYPHRGQKCNFGAMLRWCLDCGILLPLIRKALLTYLKLLQPRFHEGSRLVKQRCTGHPCTYENSSILIEEFLVKATVMCFKCERLCTILKSKRFSTAEAACKIQ